MVKKHQESDFQREIVSSFEAQGKDDRTDATCERGENFWSSILELMKRGAMKCTNGRLALARSRDNVY